jgi:transposase-like protein
MPENDKQKRMTCPECAGAMRLERVLPGFASHPELRTYRCVECQTTITLTAPSR